MAVSVDSLSSMRPIPASAKAMKDGEVAARGVVRGPARAVAGPELGRMLRHGAKVGRMRERCRGEWETGKNWI
jgi:hypothetical protein